MVNYYDMLLCNVLVFGCSQGQVQICQFESYSFILWCYKPGYRTVSWPFIGSVQDTSLTYKNLFSMTVNIYLPIITFTNQSLQVVGKGGKMYDLIAPTFRVQLKYLLELGTSNGSGPVVTQRIIRFYMETSRNTVRAVTKFLFQFFSNLQIVSCWLMMQRVWMD